jgi:hypothetical protein
MKGKMNDLEGLAEPVVASSNVVFFISFMVFSISFWILFTSRYYAWTASTFIIRERKV